MAAWDTAALPPNTRRSTVVFTSRAPSRNAAVSAGICLGSASTKGAQSRPSSGAALNESNGTRARAIPMVPVVKQSSPALLAYRPVTSSAALTAVS